MNGIFYIMLIPFGINIERKSIYMMMLPKREEFELLGDLFRDPFFRGHEHKMMKTDIKEKADKYEINIDLPGYEKENIKMSIEEGYLTINATMKEENESSDEEHFVCKERYSGSCSRSFYIGEDIKGEDIKANFKNGILQIDIPKKEEKKELPQKQYIEID